MTLQEILDEIYDVDFLKADGFDDAVVGYEPNSMRLVYDRDKMIEILVNDPITPMTEEEAIEFLEFNTWYAYVGEKTPLYIQF
jgi:hypothetical protein